MAMNTKFPIALGAFLLLSYSVASASDFVSYEGKDAVQEGTGGEKKIVDGVDFWSNGAPPRKFKVIGYITDSRFKSGLIGMMRMSGLESSIAKEAKKAGGDAVVLTNSEVETKAVIHNSSTYSSGTANTSGNMNATTSGNTTTGTFGATTTAQGQSNTSSYDTKWEQQHTRYAVIRYLADDSGTAGNGSQ
jgi:hypothetical protein